MKVRVRITPTGSAIVESRTWYFGWTYVESFNEYPVDTEAVKQKAISYAKKLLNPEIISVEKQ